MECKWIKDGELQGAVRAEMEAVKQLVQQCADNWPTGEWGEKDLSLICVMTPTRSSVSFQNYFEVLQYRRHCKV